VSNGGEPLRIVVGDDQPLILHGVAHVLSEAGFEVVATAGDAVDLVRKARSHKPDVVVTDIQMPPDGTDDGLRAAKLIRDELPDVGVLVLSQFLEARYAIDLVGERADGVGYLLKHRLGDLVTLTDAVRRVARGGSALDADVVHRWSGGGASTTPSTP
jgi:DNA-binding NarL/FixJ family response regulator